MSTVTGGARRRGIDNLGEWGRQDFLERLRNDEIWALHARLDAESIKRGKQFTPEQLEDAVVAAIAADLPKALPQFWEAWKRCDAADKAEAKRWEDIIDLREQVKKAKRRARRLARQSK